MAASPARREYDWTAALTGPNDRLKMVFSLPRPPGDGPVAVEIFWENEPENRYSAMLSHLNVSEDISHRFGRGRQIRGILEWRVLNTRNDYEDTGVFGNFHFGFPGEPGFWKHFEGVMVSFLTEIGPPEPEGETETPVEPSGSGIRQYKDLFPYIYMRIWPRTTARDLVLHFVDYAKGPADPGPLYRYLLTLLHGSLPAGGDQIRRVAVDYIEGALPWQGQFVPDIRSLSGPIRQFPELAAYVRQCPETDIETILESIEAILDLPREEWKDYIASAAYKTDLARVQDSYFALLITLGYDQQDLRTITITLVMAHLFETLVLDEEILADARKFRMMAGATVILPEAVFPLPASDRFSSLPDGPVKGCIQPYAVGDLQLASQRLLRYEPGEIAGIITIMPGERREITRRALNRVEEVEGEIRHQGERFTTKDVTSRSSLLTEALNTLAENRVITHYEDGTGFTTSYGPPITGTMTGGWDVALHPEQPSKKEASKFARKILNKAAARVERHVTRQRMSTTLDESENTEVSIFDNMANSAPLTGIYRWVNQVFEICVRNYGHRMMVEFIIQHPGALYIAQEQKKEGRTLKRPVPPKALGIDSFEAVTRYNYARLSARYKVTKITPPPLVHRMVSGVLAGATSRSLVLPEGYLAVVAKVSLVAEHFSSIRVSGLVGCHPFRFDGSHEQDCQHIPLDREDKTIDIAVLNAGDSGSPLEKPGDFQVTVEVTCIVSEPLLGQWQIDTYTAIQNGYERQKKAYYQNVDTPVGFPAMSGRAFRDIEKRQLKHQAVMLLLERYVNRVGSSGGLPGPGQPSQFEVNEPRFQAFFDRIFEWNEMTYQFYKDCGTPDKEGEPDCPDIVPDADPGFVSFLQARTARVMVPAVPDKNATVLLFLSQGMIWPEEDELAPVDASDTATVNELKKLGLAPEKEEPSMVAAWEILVPTDMRTLDPGGPPFDLQGGPVTEKRGD